MWIYFQRPGLLWGLTSGLLSDARKLEVKLVFFVFLSFFLAYSNPFLPDFVCCNQDLANQCLKVPSVWRLIVMSNMDNANLSGVQLLRREVDHQ